MIDTQKFKYKWEKGQVYFNKKNFIFETFNYDINSITTIVFIFKYLIVQFNAVCDINGTPVFWQLLNTHIQPVR